MEIVEHRCYIKLTIDVYVFHGHVDPFLSMAEIKLEARRCVIPNQLVAE